MRARLLVLALLLAACQDRDAPPSPPAPAAAEAVWTLEASAAAGQALVHTDAAGDEVLRLACLRDPPGLYAEVSGLRRIDSEDRLTLGAGDVLAVLAVSMEGPDAGLRARGQPHPAFVAALAEGRSVGLSYGAVSVDLPPPPSELRAAFAASCTQSG